MNVDFLNDLKALPKFEPHQLRVVDELRELAARHDKLWDFLNTKTYKQLEQREQDLLFEQLKAMAGYALVLRQRIEHFDITLREPKGCPFCMSDDIERGEAGVIRMNYDVVTDWNCLSCHATFYA